MNSWLPSKKLVLIFGILMIIIIGIFLFSKKEGIILYKSTKVNSELLLTQSLVKKIAGNDTDGDGLKDWEENLWKTDINNPDSDGDGTNDNDEILVNRDPLKPGPDDFIENELKNSDPTNSPTKELTTTDEVVRDLLTGYLGLKQSGEFNNENQEQLLQAIINNTLPNTSVKKYSVIDITTVNKNDIETLQKYRDELIFILDKNSNINNDLVILKESLEEKDTEKLKELIKSSQTYIKIQLAILEILVPKDLLENHLVVVNTLGSIARNTNQMANIYQDPLKALLELKQYMDNEKLLIEYFGKIGLYLEKKGVDLL